MGVSKNSGTSQLSILIGFSIINHPFWDTMIFGKHPYHVDLKHRLSRLFLRGTVRLFMPETTSGSKRFGAGWPHVVSPKRLCTNISQIGSFPEVGAKIKNV